jgi:hypothetical protein
MKGPIVLTFILAAFFFTACTDQAEPEMIGSAFRHDRENCVTTNFELNECLRWIVFRDNGTADYLPGGDIIWTGAYELKNSTITVTNPNNGQVVYTFLIESEDVLLEQGLEVRWLRTDPPL